MGMALKNNKLLSGVLKLLDTNAPTVATFGSVIGLGLTVYFMHKASKAAAIEQAKYEEEVAAIEDSVKEGETPKEEEKAENSRARMNHHMRLVYIYRWALLSGVASGGCALLANYLNGRQLAALATLLATNNEKLKAYAKKGKEMLGEEKFRALKENVENELFTKKVMKGEVPLEKLNISSEADLSEDGYEHYWDPITGGILEVPPGRMTDAIEAAERQEYLDLSGFRQFLGAPWCKAGDDYFWDNGNPFKAHVGRVQINDMWIRSIVYDNEPEMTNSTHGMGR